MSNEDAAAIERAVDAAGVASIVFFMRRFVPVLETALSALQGEAWQSCRVRMLSATIVSREVHIWIGLEKRRGRGVVGYRAARPSIRFRVRTCAASRRHAAAKPSASPPRISVLWPTPSFHFMPRRRTRSPRSSSRARTAKHNCRLSCSRANPAATRARCARRAATEHRDGRAPAPLRCALRRGRRARPGRGRAKRKDRAGGRAHLIRAISTNVLTHAPLMPAKAKRALSVAVVDFTLDVVEEISFHKK